MKKPKVSLSEVSQTIDLSEFGLSGLSESDKLSLGQDLIDRLVERTQGGQGLSFSDDGSARPVKLKSPYSKTYSESLDFEAAGKSKNRVNMELTGDMLADITVEPLSGDKIKITFNDETQIAKAYNHMVGDTVPRRPFFGVSRRDVKDVSRDYEPIEETSRTIRLRDLLEDI